MYDLDVVFLLLSSPLSTRVDEMLRLHDVAANAGFHTLIATSPAQLAATSRRLRVIVVDGDQDSDFDVYAVIKEMRGLHNVTIVFLADATFMADEGELGSGADICLPAKIGADEFCGALSTLAHDKLYGVSDKKNQLMAAVLSKNPITGMPIAPASAEPCWTLVDHGWVLCTPQGIVLGLTAKERSLMTRVFTADDKTVLPIQWDRCQGRIGSDRLSKVSALSVLVGRLRRKCARLGVKLPLCAKRGGGYAFIEECCIVQDQESNSL